MEKKGKKMARNRWVAVVMGLIMPGLGQIYNGNLLKGISYFIIFILAPVALIRFSVYLPDSFLLAGALGSMGVVLAVYVVSVVDAYRTSLRYGQVYTSKPLNRWYFYAAVWMLGAFLVTSAGNYTRDNILQAFKIPTVSMEPGILKGDYILVDKIAYRRMPPRVGDIVVFVFPDDRSKNFIGRFKGLPGDVVELDGKKEPVPHGYAFVLKDKSGDTIDSKDFGFVPLRDVLGKARQVYFSLGPEGIRWDRVGLTLE